MMLFNFLLMLLTIALPTSASVENYVKKALLLSFALGGKICLNLKGTPDFFLIQELLGNQSTQELKSKLQENNRGRKELGEKALTLINHLDTLCILKEYSSDNEAIKNILTDKEIEEKYGKTVECINLRNFLITKIQFLRIALTTELQQEQLIVSISLLEKCSKTFPLANRKQLLDEVYDYGLELNKIYLHAVFNGSTLTEALKKNSKIKIYTNAATTKPVYSGQEATIQPSFSVASTIVLPNQPQPVCPSIIQNTFTTDLYSKQAKKIARIEAVEKKERWSITKCRDAFAQTAFKPCRLTRGAFFSHWAPYSSACPSRTATGNSLLDQSKISEQVLQLDELD